MSRRVRLFTLASFLDTRRGRSLKEVAQHLEVSERTAYRDLAALDEIPVPVIRDEGGYRLLEGQGLRPVTLSGGERALLRLALASPILQRQPGLARRLQSLAAKLDSVARLSEESPAALVLAGIDRTGPLPPGALDTLAAAVAERRTVEIRYASLSGRRESWRAVDPYAVAHRADAWYLVGRCHQHAEPRTFRLDRIRQLRPSGARYERPLGFDLDAYFADSWAVYRGPGRHHIVARFAGHLAPLILSAQHHSGEEKELLPDGRVEYRVTLSHLAEINRWLMGFGPDVEVVAPAELRGRLPSRSSASPATSADDE